jgi:hypothetical protein
MLTLLTWSRVCRVCNCPMPPCDPGMEWMAQTGWEGLERMTN